MSPVVLIGLGLDNEKGITVEGLEEARRADRVFVELYTNRMTNLNLHNLETMIGKKIAVLTRTQLEDENAQEIVKDAETKTVVLLVPGDPMIATTHVSLRLTLAKKNMRSRIVHGASIVSAICGATGLQSYKFGKSITLPQTDDPVPKSVLETVQDNKARGLHTILLLDVNSDQANALTIPDALRKLAKSDSSVNEWLTVGAARIGSPSETVKAGRAKTLSGFDFGPVPHSLVFPGKLHFMEEEALRVLLGATATDLEDKQ